MIEFIQNHPYISIGIAITITIGMLHLINTYYNANGVLMHDMSTQTDIPVLILFQHSSLLMDLLVLSSCVMSFINRLPVTRSVIGYF